MKNSKRPQLPEFQPRVAPWLYACFGSVVSGDRTERADRLAEEAFELLQSVDYPKERLYALIEYVYGRDKGEPAQEVGGVMLTLAGFCLAHQLNMHAAGETELDRVWTKIEQIRAKQAAKPKGSALPIARPAADEPQAGNEKDEREPGEPPAWGSAAMDEWQHAIEWTERQLADLLGVKDYDSDAASECMEGDTKHVLWNILTAAGAVDPESGSLYARPQPVVDASKVRKATLLPELDSEPIKADDVFRPHWPPGLEPLTSYEVPCDDKGRNGRSWLRVMVAGDGDVHVSMQDWEGVPVGEPTAFPSIRIRTLIGGGRNERTRQALLWLAQAIRLDRGAAQSENG
jgi:hypothetical protein